MAVLAACLVVPDTLLAQDAPPAPPEDTDDHHQDDHHHEPGDAAGVNRHGARLGRCNTERGLHVDARREGQERGRGRDPDFTYTPPDLHIQPGDTVTWTNNGPSEHTVTAKDSSYDSDTMAVGDTFSHTYPKAGTYDYICEFHDDMTGSVIVGKSSAHRPAEGATAVREAPAHRHPRIEPEQHPAPARLDGARPARPTRPTRAACPTPARTRSCCSRGAAFVLSGAGLLRVADWY